MKSSPQLTPSWDLFNSSARYAWTHKFSLFWLAIIPSMLNTIGNHQINVVLQNHGITTPGTEAYLDVVSNSGVAQAGLGMIMVSLAWTVLALPAVMTLSVFGIRGSDDDLLTYLRRGFHYAWRVYGVTIALSVIVVVGLLALIIPGLILLRRYGLAPYYLVERDVTIKEAFRLSAEQSAEERKSVWGTLGVIVALVLLAAIVDGGLGLFGSIVSVLLATMYFFLLPLRQKEISQIHEYEASGTAKPRKTSADKS